MKVAPNAARMNSFNGVSSRVTSRMRRHFQAWGVRHREAD
jgi:hypothetical protein